MDEALRNTASHVAVIGAGCAGLATAAKLTEAGIQVTLFEASATLGGRARSVDWQGLTLDNGQHIMLGAYADTLGLLKLANVDIQLVLYRQTLKLEMAGELSLKACAKLPAPLHLLSGLLSAQGLSWHEKFASIWLMTKLRLCDFKIKQDYPLAVWLKDHQQPERLSRLLWEPLCLAALNTPMATASTQVFLNVLRDSFAKRKADSDMLIPKLDLSALMAEPLAAYIQSKGNEVKRNQRVKSIAKTETGFELSTDTSSASFSHVVIATAPFHVEHLTQDLPALKSTLDEIAQFSYQPIYTVYIQYEPNISINKPMMGFSQGYAQWVFDRGVLYGQDGLMAVIISACGAHQSLSQEALAEAVMAQLASHWPHLGQAKWHKVIAEKRATFSCTAQLKRPQQQSPIPNLYLAGDYTAGDYPATIEGAVRSGVKCATLIQQSIEKSLHAS